MASYRYIGAHLGSPFTKIADLHLDDVSWQRLKNGAGEFRAQMKLPTPDTELNRNLANLYLSATDRGTTCIYVLRDTVPMAAYIVWNQEYDSENQTVNLAGAELSSYFRRRIIENHTSDLGLDGKVTYDGVPMYNAVKDILAKINEIGIELDIQTGGPALPVTVPATEDEPEIPGTSFRGVDAKAALDVISEWADEEDGFDFRTDLDYVGENFTRRFLLRSHLGRKIDVVAKYGGFVAKSGGNVTSFKVQRRGDVRSNDAIAIGAASIPELGKKFSGRETTTDFVPTLQNIYQLNEETDVTRLDAYAVAALAATKKHEIIELEVAAGNVDAQLGTFGPGDEFRFMIPPEVDPWFPFGLDTTVRTIGYTVTVPNTQGVEEISFQLEESPFGNA